MNYYAPDMKKENARGNARRSADRQRARKPIRRQPFTKRKLMKLFNAVGREELAMSLGYFPLGQDCVEIAKALAKCIKRD